MVISLVIQGCIGLVFTLYGIYLLLSNWKKGKQVASLVYIFIGLFLLGFVAYQIL